MARNIRSPWGYPMQLPFNQPSYPGAEALPSNFAQYHQSPQMYPTRGNASRKHQHGIEDFPCQTIYTRTTASENNNFEVIFFLHDFEPEEISVRVCADNTVIVECKNEVGRLYEAYGWVSRHFICKPVIPQECDVTGVYCTMNRNMVLKLYVPKLGEGQIRDDREVEIQLV